MAYTRRHIAYCRNPIFLLGVIICWLLGSLIGCITPIEAAKGMAGISTRVLEDNLKYATKKTFSYDYNTCYSKTKEALKIIKAHIYSENQKKKMLAIYVSEEDTTPVGIFFRPIDKANTQIEVSSASTYAKELISGKIFKALNPEGEKGSSDAKK